MEMDPRPLRPCGRKRSRSPWALARPSHRVLGELLNNKNGADFTVFPWGFSTVYSVYPLVI